MIALECLAERRERDGRVREHVEALVCLTQDADLTECERAPLIGALDALRTESTLRACRRPADEMDGRDYDGMSAMSFVRHCYDRGERAFTDGRICRPRRKRTCWPQPDSVRRRPAGGPRARRRGLSPQTTPDPAERERVHLEGPPTSPLRRAGRRGWVRAPSYGKALSGLSI